MDTQVSPAVVVVVLILVAAILLGVYFIVFVPVRPGDADSAATGLVPPPTATPGGLGHPPAPPPAAGAEQPVKSKAPETMANSPKPDKTKSPSSPSETNPVPATS